MSDGFRLESTTHRSTVFRQAGKGNEGVSSHRSCPGPRHLKSGKAMPWPNLQIVRFAGKNREEAESASSRDSFESGNADVFRLPAFRPFHDVKLDRLAFLKRTESIALDG